MITIDEISAEFRSGISTPIDHIEMVLGALDEMHDSPWANLVVGRDDRRARDDAERATREMAQGRTRGPLHGVAIAVKDNIDVQGLPTRAGSALFATASVAQHDAASVTALRARGAIVVAKTHLHELAYGSTGQVSADGPAVHPHDHHRITGGSSSGSAALIARGVVPLALGTDTGCSVRVPAALCGTVGLRPAMGRISSEGVVPLSPSFDQVGLMASDISGTRHGWAALADLDSTPTGHLAGPPSELRVGLPQGPTFHVHDPDISAAVSAAAETLRQLGYTTIPVDQPDLDRLAATYPPIVGYEANTTHRTALRVQPHLLQPTTRARLAEHADRTASEHAHLLHTMAALRRRVLHTLSTFYRLDALLLPTSPLRAPLATTTRIGHEDVAQALLRLCVPFSALGVASASVPAPSTLGLPIGLQLAALTLDEDQLLAAASQITKG